MATLKQFLSEALTPRQQTVVDSWTPSVPPAKKLSEHVFGGKEVLMHPLNQSGSIDVQPHPDVEQHLKKFGYSIPSGEEYKAGYAVDKYNRIVSIGKALSRSKAPDDVVQKFEHDPNRASGASNLSVAYTWHPHHVAGMSTDRGWTSCMDMTAGGNSSYLHDDIHQGTHVAYLVHSDDEKIERPLARIALKPYSSIDGHTIIRPDVVTHGMGKDSFTRQVSDWTETHFPAKKDTTYNLHYGLYPEREVSTFVSHSPETIKNHVDNMFNGNALLSDQFARNVVNPNDIHHLVTGILSKTEKDVRDPHNIKNDKAYAINSFVSSTKHVHPETLGNIVDAIHSGDVAPTADLMFKLDNHGPKMAPEHARKFMDIAIIKKHQLNENEGVLQNPAVTNHQVMDVVKTGMASVHNLPQSVITSDVVNHFHRNIHTAKLSDLSASNVLESKNLGHAAIHDVMDHIIANDEDSGYHVKSAALRLNKNPNYTIDMARDMDSKAYRRTDSFHKLALLHPKATVDDLVKAQDESIISGYDLRNISSPEVLSHTFKKIDTQSSMINARYIHTPIPNIPEKHTINSVVGVPEGVPNIRNFVRHANPYTLFSPADLKKSQKNILGSVQILHKDEPSHDAINHAARRAVEYDDTDFAHKIIATASLEDKVPFDKDIIDAVSKHHDVSFAKVK